MTVAELAKKLRKLGEETATNFQGWKSVATSPKLRTEFVNQGVKPLVSSAFKNTGNRINNIPSLTTNQNIRRPFGDVLQQSAGQIMQRTPSPKLPSTTLGRVAMGAQSISSPFGVVGNLGALAAGKLGSEAVRSYGRTFERTATPEGRKQLYQTLQRVKQIGFKPGKSLADPGVEDVLNLADIIPVGKMAGAGLKTAGKGVKALNAVGNMAGFARIPKKTPGIKPIITKPLDELIGVTAEPTQQTLAKMAEKKIKIVEKANRLAQPRSPTIGDITGMIKKSTVSPIAKEVDQYKDIGNLAKGFKDVYRNFETVFGKAFPKVKAQILDPFDASKGKFIDMQVDLAEDLEKNVIKRLGINKGSKLSELVQRFGEGKMTLEDLQKEAPKDWQNVIEADKWFRGKYDELLNQVNSVRARIYPGQPDKIIPKRQDYYRHFQDFTDGFRGILKIFDSPANISSDLVGKSEFTKPKSKWLSFAQRRLGDYTDQDAVGGFLNYLKAASYATHIDQHIPRFRALADELASATLPDSKSAGKLNNFIDYLQEFSNQLSGKTGVLERPIQRFIPGGRKTMSLLNALNSRVKANVIVGNLSSAVAQAFNVPQGIADAGVDNFAKGLGRSFADIFEPQKVMKQSNFLKERYAGDIYSKFDKDLLSKPRQMAVWTTQVLDEVGTKLIWNAEYEKALKIGTPNPVKYADDFTRKMVGGRGIGEVPLIQQDRFFQLIAPFQLEVGNTLSVMGDWASNKQLGKLATFFIASHLFNRTAKAIRGSDVSFDPIQASLEAMDAYIEEEDKATGVMRAGGRLAGEVLSNVPLGQTAASVYPEYGFKIGERQMPTRKDLFGEGDPTRFGGGLLVSKGLQDPLFKVIPSFGGQQLKRTIEGLSSYNRGYSETDSGKVRYPINQGVGNFLKTATFGEYSTPEARKYFDSGATPLGENQSEIFKQKGTDYYNKIMNIRDSKKNPQKEQGSVLEGWLDTNRSVGAAGSLPTDDTEVLYLYEGALSSLGKYGDNKLKANYGLADKTLEEYQMEADEALEMKRLVEKERPDIARFVKTKEKDSRDYALNENKKQRAEKDEDYKTWLDLAKKQLEILDRQMQDPTLDEVALSDLEEKAANLIDEITKYEGYGGSFKKGKKITIKDTNLKIAKPESRAIKVTATKKPDLDIDIKAPTFKMSTPPLTNIQDKFIIKQSPAKKFKIKRKQISVKLGK